MYVEKMNGYGTTVTGIDAVFCGYPLGFSESLRFGLIEYRPGVLY